eukprot:10613853-Lingulodinium_polyedra.AAC.1
MAGLPRDAARGARAEARGGAKGHPSPGGGESVAIAREQWQGRGSTASEAPTCMEWQLAKRG